MLTWASWENAYASCTKVLRFVWSLLVYDRRNTEWESPGLIKIRVCVPSSYWLHSGFWKNGYDLVLFKDKGKLVLLNSNEETSRNLSLINEIRRVCYVDVYLETLFSPNFPGITDWLMSLFNPWQNGGKDALLLNFLLVFQFRYNKAG